MRRLVRSLPPGWRARLWALRSDGDRLALGVRRALARRGRAASAEAARYPRGVVSITFDDDLGDAYHRARPLMDGFGWGGTGYLLAHTVGEVLTLEQLHRLEDEHGWEIAGHGFARHDDLSTLAPAEVEAELRGTRAWLDEHGFRGRHHFAYPYSGNDRTVRALAARYFETARVVAGGGGTDLPPEPGRRHRLGAFTWGAGFTTVPALAHQLDRTRAAGGWAILVFHGLDRSDRFSIASEEFRAILAHIEALGMDVAPVGAVLGTWDRA
jgi:peptidoglycan/xylan/chitin deacetylase (PgdA/CDA1 family)